jgi:hypothetical protein
MLRQLEKSGNLEIGFEAKAVLKLLEPALERTSDAASVNSALSARAEKLSNIENSLNTLANFMEALGIIWGVPTMLVGCMSFRSNMNGGIQTLLYGLAGILGGLATPGCINWLVASFRDANNGC